MRDVPQDVRVQSLIAREVSKRCWWALVSQDWFGIVSKPRIKSQTSLMCSRTAISENIWCVAPRSPSWPRLTDHLAVVQPTQVTTPLPSNAHDEYDHLQRSSGSVFDALDFAGTSSPASSSTGRHPSTRSSASCSSGFKSLAAFKSVLLVVKPVCPSDSPPSQEIFEHMDRNANPSYRLLLDVDERLSSIISNCPKWLHDDGPTVGMPPCVDWVRNTFRISSNHKVLTLHRPFLHRAFRGTISLFGRKHSPRTDSRLEDPRFESSRIRAITASRAILREAARCSDSRLWTIPCAGVPL